MTVQKAIQDRKSIRSFLDKEISQQDLHTVLEAARLSPSARNLQNWKIIAVADKDKINKLQLACGNQKQVGMAPVTLVVCANESYAMTCGQQTSSIDCSIAMSFMMLQAHELGLGTCWLGHFEEDKVKEILNIPKDYVVVAVSPLGYADSTPPNRGRKAFDEVVCFEEFK